MTIASGKDWNCLVVGSLLRDVWTMEGMELEYRDVRSRKRDPVTKQNMNNFYIEIISSTNYVTFTAMTDPSPRHPSGHVLYIINSF
jgi:hypothetical protein